ncbi:helix-turn-helix transcriptional regulator [Ruminococcus sp. NK3A76]|uniref:helix-turn-helix domain-containing protein n=1 Tax=Ruminococcus sp. NK3A76 TaxID=877411 RepID=UPI000491144A|nr:helix-turn-helix transcriptional regulator [Ruminococcus sp. NK3A76]
MGRTSKKEHKNIYHFRREELGLSREKASEILESIPPERIEKIENEKSLPHPEEILTIYYWSYNKTSKTEIVVYKCTPADQTTFGSACFQGLCFFIPIHILPDDDYIK